jgi:hypothetical protein
MAFDLLLARSLYSAGTRSNHGLRRLQLGGKRQQGRLLTVAPRKMYADR